MATISDEAMRELLTKVKPYSVVILRAGPQWHRPNVEQIIWEHCRRNLELRAQGKLATVCPVTDESDVCGPVHFLTLFLTRRSESWRDIRVFRLASSCVRSTPARAFRKTRC